MRSATVKVCTVGNHKKAMFKPLTTILYQEGKDSLGENTPGTPTTL